MFLTTDMFFIHWTSSFKVSARIKINSILWFSFRLHLKSHPHSELKRHLPFLRKSVRCTVCSSPNVTYLNDCRDIFGVWIDIANNIIAIKGWGRSTRLLRHTKMLLIPIKSLLSARYIMLWKVLHLHWANDILAACFTLRGHDMTWHVSIPLSPCPRTHPHPHPYLPSPPPLPSPSF